MPFDVPSTNSPDPLAFFRIEYKSLQLVTDLLGSTGLTDRRHLAERCLEPVGLSVADHWPTRSHCIRAREANDAVGKLLNDDIAPGKLILHFDQRHFIRPGDLVSQSFLSNQRLQLFDMEPLAHQMNIEVRAG